MIAIQIRIKFKTFHYQVFATYRSVINSKDVSHIPDSVFVLLPHSLSVGVVPSLYCGSLCASQCGQQGLPILLFSPRNQRRQAHVLQPFSFKFPLCEGMRLLKCLVWGGQADRLEMESKPTVLSQATRVSKFSYVNIWSIQKTIPFGCLHRRCLEEEEQKSDNSSPLRCKITQHHEEDSIVDCLENPLNISPH